MYTITLIPMLVGLDYFYHNGLILTISIAAPLVGISTVLLVCIVTIIVKKTLMGKLTPGNYSITSFDYLCWWVVDRFKYNSYISVLSDSLFLPILMRFLGAKIGKKVEIGRLPLISPDLLTIGDRSLTAEFVIIGAPRIYNGFATFKNIFIGNQTFIGNSALLPPGTKLGDNCLVGCLSTIPKANSDNIPTNNTAWIGSPAIFLPQREQTAKIFSDMETYNPTLSLYLKRLSIESIRVILPAIFSFIYFIAYFYMLIFTLDNFSFGNTIMLLPAFAILIIIIMALSVVAFKWILVGKLHPMIKPLWCTFIWKYDIIIQLCSEFLWPMLSPLMGTPFLAIFCRLFGAKIGRRTYIGTTEFTEFDLITIGDDVSLNERCCIQNHLYEDRIFKMSTIIINDGCNIGNRSIVLYDTEMASNSSLCNLSLLMKGEHLPSNTKWQGIPAQIRH
jgi:non-ribosomal peptide synthetase-like protein